MTALLRWAHRILDAGLVLTLLVLVVIGGLTLVAPALGGRTFVIGGGSMGSALPNGSYILAIHQPAASYAVGDLVTVQEPGRTPYTHRVVRLATLSEAPYVETKGDANASADPTIVPVASVVGRVALQLPLLGFLAAVLASPLGLFGFLAISATLLCLCWLIEDLEEGPCPICAGIAGDRSVPDIGEAQTA